MNALANAINAMLERLDRGYQSQARFVSDASHELRTPISVIQGYANMLDRWGKDDRRYGRRPSTPSGPRRPPMGTLVEQLLSWPGGTTTPRRSASSVWTCPI